MSNHRNLPATSVLMLALAGTLASCVNTAPPLDESASENYPVIWTPEFSMSDLLENSIDVNTRTDLAQLLHRQWYAGIEVTTSSTSAVRTLTNCNDYFLIKSAKPETQRESENNALRELIIQCEATRLLDDASPAHRSNIRPTPFDSQLLDNLPKDLALITSKNERDRIRRDNTISRFSDVNAVTDIKRITENRFEYYSDAGLQILSLTGRGDFDSDGWEDILIRITDTVQGGSYFNMRLFVLTVDEQGDWRVIAEY